MDLRKHQIECINNIKLHFENENCALIKFLIIYYFKVFLILI